VTGVQTCALPISAAYRHACKLEDDRQQLTHSYEKKTGVEHSEILAPFGAPDWVRNRNELWNRADAAEKRKDAITAREILISLPRELDLRSRIDLVKGFIRSEFVDRGIVADLAFHAGTTRDGEEQPHVHVMLVDRVLDPATASGLASKKDRTLAQADGVELVRERWAEHCNRALERACVGERVDHRSLAAQRAEAISCGDEAKAIELDRPPEPKIGPVAMQMERQGRARQAHALRDVDQVREVRRERFSLAQTFRELGGMIHDLRDRISRAATDARTALEQFTATFMAGPELAAANNALMIRDAERQLAERQRIEAIRQQERRAAEERARNQPQPSRGSRGRGFSL